MKNILLYTFFLVFVVALNAQKEVDKITTAGGTSIAEAFYVKDVISVKQHGFLVIQSYIIDERQRLEFQVFDHSRTLTNRQNLFFDERQGEPFVQGYTEWHDHFILFLSYYQEATSTNELYVYKYSLPDLTLELETKIMEAFSPVDLYIPFLHSTSKDDSKLAVTAWSYALPADPAKVEIKVFNEAFKVIREESYLFPYDNEELYLKEVIVDNVGNPYLVGKIHSGKYEASYEELNDLRGNAFVLAYLTGEKKPNLYEIDVKKYKFPLLEFDLNPNQELVGLGFYRYGSKNAFTGVCMFTIHPEKKSLQLSTSEISKDVFINALGDNPATFKSTNYFRNAHIKDVILKDNAYFLVGEQVLIRDRRDARGAYVYQNQYLYQYNPNSIFLQDPHGFNQVVSISHLLLDIFIIKVDKNGNMQWMRRIPKQQKIEEDEAKYLSFSVIERERDLLLFYNDHPDNYTFKEKDKVKKTELRSAMPMLAKVRCSSGKVTKRKLSSLFGKNTLIRPGFCKMLGAEKVFMYGQKKKWDLATYRMKIANLGGD